MDKAADARRDVIAYMRAVASRNGDDAGVILAAALSGNGPEFLFQLSTFCGALLELQAMLTGFDVDSLLAQLQAVELAQQAGE